MVVHVLGMMGGMLAIGRMGLEFRGSGIIPCPAKIIRLRGPTATACSVLEYLNWDLWGFRTPISR
jgi:hypothetical protein